MIDKKLNEIDVEIEKLMERRAFFASLEKTQNLIKNLPDNDVKLSDISGILSRLNLKNKSLIEQKYDNIIYTLARDIKRELNEILKSKIDEYSS